VYPISIHYTKNPADAGKREGMVKMEISNPKAVAELGEKIYDDAYRSDFEAKYPGKFVAIDIQSKQAYVGDAAEEALDAARQAAPKGVFHLIKVGSAGAFRVSYTSNGHLDWLLR
jgi:hypothetical protein